MAVDELLLGYTDEGVHAFIDQSAAWLGFGHRSVRHTTKTIEYLEDLKGSDAARIALLHILIVDIHLRLKTQESRAVGY